MAAAPLPFDPIEEARRQWEAHGWRGSASGMAAVTSVMRAQQIFLSRVDALLRPFGLTFARYEVLVLLTPESDQVARTEAARDAVGRLGTLSEGR